MIQNTFIIGGESKFASKFIERLNKRFGEELTLKIHSHKEWDQSGCRSESIPKDTDLVLVMKSNVNHSLRNWARKKASDSSVRFIECSHKTAIAEIDLRHCYQLSSSASFNTFEADEEKDLYEQWGEILGDKGFLMPLWGMEDEGLFIGKDAYERMPWSMMGKKKMISKWDKLWFSYTKEMSSQTKEIINYAVNMGGKKSVLAPLYDLNNGKSPYYRLIKLIKQQDSDSLGYAQVKAWADQWVKDSYLGTNLRDFTGKRNLDYALGTIFGVSIEELSSELKDLLDEHYDTKRKAKRKSKKPTSQIKVVEEEVSTVEEEEVPTVEEDYIMLGGVKITPNNTVINLDEVHLSLNQVHIKGSVHLSIERIENNVLYGVQVKRKDT